MKCAKCGSVVPLPADPTARETTCQRCGDIVVLADDDITVGFEGDSAAVEQVPPLDAGREARMASSHGTVDGPPDNQCRAWIGRVLEGRYRITHWLASGGMGHVFVGCDIRLNRYVAVKVLSEDLQRDPVFIQRFKREADTLKDFQHPNIVDIYSRGEAEGGEHYIVMPYICGPEELAGAAQDALRRSVSLADALAATVLQGKPGLDFRRAKGLVLQVLSALDYARRKKAGFIHRDIKPGNVLIDEGWNAKLVDFGIARGVAAARGETTLTGAGQSPGTPKYMAPEQENAPGSADHRSDLYAVGAMLYRILVNDYAAGRFRPLSERREDLDATLDAVIDRAMQQNPDDRYQTAEEFAAALTAVPEKRAGRLDGAPPLSPDHKLKRSPPTRGVGRPAAVLAAVGVGLGLFFYLRENKIVSQPPEVQFRAAIVANDKVKFDTLLAADPALARHVYTEPTNHNQTPLHLVAENARPQMVKPLLDAGSAADVNKFDARGKTPLHYAVQAPGSADQGRVAKSLLLAGADPEKEDNNKKSCFQAAIDSRSTNVVALLGGARIRKDLEDSKRNPLNAGANSARIQQTMKDMEAAGVTADWFMAQNADEGAGSLLDLFTHAEQEDITRALFQMSLTNWHEVYFTTNRNGLTAIQQAVKNTNFAVARIFIDNLKSKLPSPDDQNRVVNGEFALQTGVTTSRTALLHASLGAREGQEKLALSLLDAGAYTAVSNASGQYPLHLALAAQAAEQPLVTRLVSTQAGPPAVLNALCLVEKGWWERKARSAIEYAILGGYRDELAQAILDRGSRMNAAVFAAALERTNFALVNRFLSGWRTNDWGDVALIANARYVDPDDKLSSKPLVCLAVSRRDIMLVRTLLRLGIETNSVDCGGCSLMDLARIVNDPEILRLLGLQISGPTPGPTNIVFPLPSPGPPSSFVKSIVLYTLNGAISGQDAQLVNQTVAQFVRDCCRDVKVQTMSTVPPNRADLSRIRDFMASNNANVVIWGTVADAGNTNARLGTGRGAPMPLSKVAVTVSLTMAYADAGQIETVENNAPGEASSLANKDHALLLREAVVDAVKRLLRKPQFLSAAGVPCVFP